MNIKTATQILKRHNKWRRGDEEILPVEPKRLGVAIDTILEKLQNHSDLSHVSEILDKLEFEKKMAHSGMVDCVQEVDDSDEANRYEGEERAYKKAIEIVSSR